MEQVGGDHYKSNYQHWDWAVDVGLGPLEYGATRYICRHWKKDGVEDLKKAKHFVEKLMELNQAGCYSHYKDIPRGKRSLYFIESMSNFVKENKLPYIEARLCERLATWNTDNELFTVRVELEYLIKTSEMAAGAPAPAQATTPAKPPLKDVQTPAAGSIDTSNTIVLKQPHLTCPICGLEETEHHICGESSE